MSILVNLLKDLFCSKNALSELEPRESNAIQNIRPVFLNVGGGSKQIKVPEHFTEWEHVLLDIDPATGADVICDARLLDQFKPGQYDAIYCSHNLEHYYHHDVRNVLRGFMHVLKESGFAEIRVPDIGELVHYMVEHKLDLNEIAYESPAGPIAFRDVMWGFGRQIEESGVDFYAHKTGFTETTLMDILKKAGFMQVYMLETYALFELHVVAFKNTPTPKQLELFSLKID